MFLSSAIAIILVIGGSVFVHELGHFLVAKAMGIRVYSFAFGFGPRLISYRRGRGWYIVGRDRIEPGQEETQEPTWAETEYALCLIPLGGFVKMEGQELGRESYSERSFRAKALWKRALVLSAGPFMNFVLAILLMWILFMVGSSGIIPEYDMDTTVIADVVADSPAEQAGLKAGDQIVSLDGKPVKGMQDAIDILKVSSDRELPIIVLREGEEVALKVTPELTEGVGKVGVILVPKQIVEKYGFFKAFPRAVSDIGKTVYITVLAFIMVAKGQIEATNAVAGPVGIAGMIGQAVALGIVVVIKLTAIINTAFGFFNILPLPILDGGICFF